MGTEYKLTKQEVLDLVSGVQNPILILRHDEYFHLARDLNSRGEWLEIGSIDLGDNEKIDLAMIDNIPLYPQIKYLNLSFPGKTPVLTSAMKASISGEN